MHLHDTYRTLPLKNLEPSPQEAFVSHGIPNKIICQACREANTDCSTRNFVKIIDGALTSLLDGEVTWDEVVREALWHVDRDSTHKDQIARAVLGVHNVYHLPQDRFISNLC